mgnify:CR=1 FL=1
MQLDNSLISRLEKLARLKLDDSERAALLADLNRILEMVEKINELDTAGIAPLAYPVETNNPLRADEPGTHLSPEQALQNAPKHDGQFFQVPKFIE